MGPQSPQPSIHIITTTMIFVFLSWPYTQVQSQLRIHDNYGCTVGDMVVPFGYVWKRRCNNVCTCTEEGERCTKPCPGPLWGVENDHFCGKWSADGCCCEAIGCPGPNGAVIAIGADIPRDPEKPCEACTCSGGESKNCGYEMCPIQLCYEPLKQEPGVCCGKCLSDFFIQADNDNDNNRSGRMQNFIKDCTFPESNK